MHKLRNYFMRLALLQLFLIVACKQNNRNIAIQNSKECIDYIFKKDDSLGTIRNHACKKISLSETITQYTTNLNKLDFSNCPGEFSNAFKAHSVAWNNMKTVTDNHKYLRGEMHDLFDSIKNTKDSSEFNQRLKSIWDTWKIIEKAKGQ